VEQIFESLPISHVDFLSSLDKSILLLKKTVFVLAGTDGFTVFAPLDKAPGS